MRYTLSVLTAVCLLALGQPAWSDSVDRELLKRARIAASALPDNDRASAALVLRELQAQYLCAKLQRHLPLQRNAAAVQRVLKTDYRSALQSHVLAQPLVGTLWLKPVTIDLHVRPNVLLDAAMVQRWAEALQMA